MKNTLRLARLAIPVIAAIALQVAAARVTAGDGSTTAQSHKPAPKSQTKSKAAPKSPVTISITSHIRHGNLIVALDHVTVFHEQFDKPALLIQQTTTWDPLQVPAGRYRLTAKVEGSNGKTYLSAEYDLELAHAKGIELHFKLKGDALTVEQAS
jgi:hypothetical protein